jgi:guanylate kinase
MRTTGKVIIFSAPSGSGKSTIVAAILSRFDNLEFSISATSRPPRQGERDGREYYFLSADEFARRVERGDFTEWEEVYAGTRYGTLRSEIERIWAAGRVILFDLDVKGGLRLKQLFGDAALSIFVMPPSIDELERRLLHRGTESAETIRKRIDRAGLELSHAPQFDRIIVNDDLEKAVDQTERAIREFLMR